MMNLEYKTNLKDVEFHKDKNGDCYLLLSYTVENSDGSIDQFTFPSVRLNICKHSFSITNDYDFDTTFIDCGFGKLALDCGQVKTREGKTIKGVRFLKETIKEAPAKEMTLDEIEKKLGHKVKIVNQKGDK